MPVPDGHTPIPQDRPQAATCRFTACQSARLERRRAESTHRFGPTPRGYVHRAPLVPAIDPVTRHADDSAINLEEVEEVDGVVFPSSVAGDQAGFVARGSHSC